MLRLIIVLLFLFFAIWIGLEVTWHPGYLFISAKPWLIQMPLWFAICCTFLFLVLFYYLISGIDYFNLLAVRFKNWRHNKQGEKASSRTQRGLIALQENEWHKAEKWLIAGAVQSPEPLSNFFALAKAAHYQGEFQKRDEYLKTAIELVPSAKLAADLLKAELLIESKAFDEAIVILLPIKEEIPTQPKVLALLQQIYQNYDDSEKLFKLLPLMRKAKLYSKDTLDDLEINQACEMFAYANEKSLTEIQEMWRALPRHLRHDPNITAAYILQLNHHATTNGPLNQEIKNLIKSVLKKNYDPELVLLYGSYSFQSLERELVLLGAWLKMYGEQQALLFVLGKFCAQLKLWGRAKDYYEKCLAKGPYPVASLAYGELLETLAEDEKALKIYQTGLIDCTH